MIDFDASEFFSIFEDLQQDITMLGDLLQDPSFVDDVRTLAANNFDRVWSTQGANIGSDWNGNDLVQTGNLRLSLTTAGSINLMIVGDTVTLTSSVSYARHVDDRYSFYGIDSVFDQEFTALVENYLQTRGQLNWS